MKRISFNSFLFLLLISSCYRPEDPDLVFTHKIINNSSFNIWVEITKNDGTVDSIFIGSMSDYTEENYNSAMFTFQDKQVSFIFEDGKCLNYYYDSIKVQRINNPYYTSEFENGFNCDTNNNCVYLLTNEDYQRAELDNN